MPNSEFEVATYADLDGAHLQSAGKDRVLQALQQHEAVLWLEDWLREEKELEPLEGTQTLFGGRLVASTDSAWCVGQGEDTEVWVPKSCAECYRRHEDGLLAGNRDQANIKEWL